MKVVHSLLESCFSIVELLAAEARSVRLSDLADRLNLPRSGVHRVLTTLLRLGWVEQDGATELYRLSLKLPAIGYRFAQSVRLPDVCQPVIDRVASESRELVRLAAVAGDGLATIAHAQGAQGSLICRSRTFPTLPLHVSASGKAWLATLPRERAIKLLLETGLAGPPTYGPRAMTSIEELIAELDRTTRRGYAVAVEEAEEAIGAVAAAIRPNGAVTVGALAIVAPVFRLKESRISELARLVRSAAEELAVVWPLRGASWLTDAAAA